MGREEMDSRCRGNNGEWAWRGECGDDGRGRRVAVSAEGGVGV